MKNCIVATSVFCIQISVFVEVCDICDVLLNVWIIMLSDLNLGIPYCNIVSKDDSLVLPAAY